MNVYNVVCTRNGVDSEMTVAALSAEQAVAVVRFVGSEQQISYDKIVVR